MEKIDAVWQELNNAFTDAYGRSQATPDGMYCRTGRIDRSYDIAASRGNPAAAMSVIDAMGSVANQAFDKVDRLAGEYRRLCKLKGETEQIIELSCDCPNCKRVPTFGGK